MFEAKLISEVYKNECLWNKGLAAYRDKQQKDITWLNLARAVGEPEELCRKRWKSLRDRFVHELRTQMRRTYDKSEANGTRREWVYFKPMSFLKNCVTPGVYTNKMYQNVLDFDDTQEALPEMSATANATNTKSSSYDPFPFAEVGDHEEAEYLIEKQTAEADEDDGQISPKRGRLENNSPPPPNVTELLRRQNSNNNNNSKSTDPFLGVIGDFFDKVPEDKKYAFKMDILNYVYERYEVIKRN